MSKPVARRVTGGVIDDESRTQRGGAAALLPLAARYRRRPCPRHARIVRFVRPPSRFLYVNIVRNVLHFISIRPIPLTFGVCVHSSRSHLVRLRRRLWSLVAIVVAA